MPTRPDVTPELFDDLVVVVAVADARSVAGAARALGVDGSTVSRRVRRLEDSLGIALFHRGGRGMELAEPGRRLVQRVQAAMNEVSLGLDEALLDGDGLRGRVIVTAPTELGTAFFTPIITAFSLEHPDVDFVLELGDRVLSLDKREADIALRTMRPEKGDVVARKLRGPLGYIVRSPELAPDDARQRWLAYTGRDPIVDDIVESVPGARVVLRTNDLAGLRAACQAGMGASLMPEPFVELLGLVPMEGFEPVQLPPLFLCAPSVSLELPRVRALWDAIVESYTQILP
ncbi:MAG: LysR family transcriptional regulator [Nannocystales bacterium]